MNRLQLTSALALSVCIAACGGGNTVTGAHSSDSGIGRWMKYEDPIDGSKGKIRYRLASEDNQSFITIMCEGGQSDSLVTFMKGQMPFDTSVEATLRFDDGEPEKHNFIIKADDSAAQYANATRADAVAFRNLLVGHEKLAMRIDTMSGLAVTDPPNVFTLTGIDNVVEDVAKVCPA